MILLVRTHAIIIPTYHIENDILSINQFYTRTSSCIISSHISARVYKTYQRKHTYDTFLLKQPQSWNT